jgi:Uncharacterized conserved protein
MSGHHGRQLASKWAKTAALLSHPALVPLIPPTRIYSALNLKAMLDMYGTVVVKPVVGSGGSGVMKVSRIGTIFALTYRERTERLIGYPALVKQLTKRMRGRKYLIQKGISLATVNGKPIDYRVKYVKTFGGWEYRAVVGRIARPGLFVTNLNQGGMLVTAAQGIRASLGPSYVKSKKKQMKDVTALATRVLEQRYPGLVQLGFDYGIDRTGKLWIFEVNTRPH